MTATVRNTVRRTARPARRGAVLPLVCVVLTALLGAGALAIDLGRLYYTAQEVQTAADAAALAAMRAKQYQPIDYPSSAIANAKAAARNVAARNKGAGVALTVTDADVVPVTWNNTTRTVSPSSWTYATSAITVTVRATPAYVLGRALGLTPPEVRRSATAWLANVNGGNCVRPLSINYTRFYEHGVTWDDRYTSRGQVAPDFNQWDIANTQYAPLPRRTFTILPPDSNETNARNRGEVVHGNWRPVVLGTGAGGELNAITAQLSAAEGSAGCQAARAVLGDLKNPPTSPKPDVMQAVHSGMRTFCNRAVGSTNAWCYNSRNTVGVKARILSSDSTPQPGGGFKLHVREVGVARIMCYFQNRTDTCNPVQMSEREASGTWQPLGSTTNYPPGTIMYFIDSPGSTNITSDVVLGDKPGLTQRLLLVK